MEKKPLPIGIDNFEKLITRGYYFVDKTLLIRDLLDNKADVTLFTRPRRFGKTLNMSMIQYFFEDERNWSDGSKKDNAYLFEGMKIINEGEEYISHMGQYPIISLSLKSAKQPTFELAYSCLKDKIIEEFKRHRYILNSKMPDDDRNRYESIMNNVEDERLYVTSLEFLSKCLENYHNKKAIILIDEYDVPLENSFFKGFYEKMIDFIRSLFESALKTNPHLEFAVITGCLFYKETHYSHSFIGISDSHQKQVLGSLLKKSIFTGLNNLKIISILNDRYSEHFGFTHDEVIKICSDYNMNEKYETIKEWYNGYTFGESNVYNPWSVMQYVDDLKANINKLPSSYWANTSSNSIVKSLIEKADDETKREIELLIEGKTIEKPVHEDITYDEVYNSVDNIYNFMFFTGYLKKVGERMDEEDNRFIELAIPNREIKYIFREKVLKWFDAKIKSESLQDLYTAVINGNVEFFQKEINRLLRKTISFNDAYENFYHGFLVGVLSKMDGYIVKSNRECGHGRSDIYIRPLSIFQRAVIIEIKVCNKPKEIFTKGDEALMQIEKMNYEHELMEEGYEDIIKYGMAFYRKDCLIKMK